MATTEHSDLEQQIIKTAQQLFIEKGFVETSMSDIAATVGINRPTLHYYFRTKDKMFKAVFGSIVMSLMPKIQDIVKQDIPFMERLSMILDEYIELFTSNPCLPRFICGEIQRDVPLACHCKRTSVRRCFIPSERQYTDSNGRR